MKTAKNAGRTIAVLMLLQMVGAPLMNFGLMGPVTRPPGFLENAAANAPQIAIAVLIGIALGAVSIGMAIVAWPVLRQRSQAMAMWFLALAIVGFALIAIEQSTVLSMLSLSQTYATLATADQGLYQALGGVVGSARKWAHYINLIVSAGTLGVFYGALYRFALVPRLLAAAGVASVLLMLVAVVMPLFGHRIVFALISPLGLTQLVLAAWLLAKGLPESSTS